MPAIIQSGWSHSSVDLARMPLFLDSAGCTQLSRCAFPVVRLCSYWNRCLYIRMSERVGAMLQAGPWTIGNSPQFPKRFHLPSWIVSIRSNPLKQIWKSPGARSVPLSVYPALKSTGRSISPAYGLLQRRPLSGVHLPATKSCHFLWWFRWIWKRLEGWVVSMQFPPEQ